MTYRAEAITAYFCWFVALFDLERMRSRNDMSIQCQKLAITNLPEFQCIGKLSRSMHLDANFRPIFQLYDGHHCRTGDIVASNATCEFYSFQVVTFEAYKGSLWIWRKWCPRKFNSIPKIALGIGTSMITTTTWLEVLESCFGNSQFWFECATILEMFCFSDLISFLVEQAKVVPSK